METSVNNREIVVGIDLGTTNSAIGIYENNRVRLFENSLGEKLTPSVVAYDEKQNLICVGRMAKDIYALNKKNAVALFKRYMGKEDSFKLNNKNYTPIELSSLILQSLKEDAEHALGHEVRRCVITVPAYFSEEQRYATQKAGEIAGFTVERILNEPTAAAICYGLEKRGDFSKFLVFDLGGGTFDVCVMEIFDGALEVSSVAGVSQLGGEDFTLELLKLALQKAGLTYEQVLERDESAIGLLYKRVELAKIKLGDSESADIVIPDIKVLLNEPKTVTITKEESHETYKPLISKLIAPCTTALRGARIKKDELDEIILVGGATRMPIIKNFVESFFDKDCLAIFDPDLVVAHGASIQGALYANHEDVGDVVITDVLSYSLGIEVTKEFGNKWISGFFSPIIHRNTVIPVTKSDLFSPINPGQTTMKIEIYEGESRHVNENRIIGSLEVKNIPKSEHKNSVEVRFTYDLNGILEVEAKVVDTGEVFTKILNRSNKALSDVEIEKAKIRIKDLKKDYRENSRIKALILRIELLIKDLSDKERKYLEGRLDAFEMALEDRNQDEIEELFLELTAICENYDKGIQW